MKGIPAQTSQLIRNLLSNMQIILPLAAEGIWQAEETDTLGRYLAKYEFKENKDGRYFLEKKKDRYLKLDFDEPGASPKLKAAKALIEKSKIQAVLEPVGQWILSVCASEGVILTSDGDRFGKNELVFKAKVTDFDGPFPLPADYKTLAGVLKSDRFLQARYKQTDPKLNRIGEKRNLEGVLKLFDLTTENSLTIRSNEGQRLLVNYLRQKPSACIDLVDYIDRQNQAGTKSGDIRVYWYLLAQAGHEQAQEALLKGAFNPYYSHKTRRMALANLHMLEYPQDFTIDDLADFYDSLAFSDNGDEQELAAMSLFVIGSLGSSDKLNDEVKEAVRERLSEKLQNTADSRQVQNVLAAIGNSGQSELLDEVEPYLINNDPRIRGSAYEALRRMKSPEASEALRRNIEGEAVPSVREKALESLGSMPPTSEAMNWAKDYASSGYLTKGERTRVANYLGKNLPQYPENDLALRDMLDQNPSLKVKREIYKYIQPR